MPLPWYTYPATSFLGDRLPSNAQVFEYGAGHSSLWYASHCRRVVSVENDSSWFADISRRLPDNAHCVLQTAREPYITEIRRHDGPFDVIAIDGQWRSECAAEAVHHLTPSGVFVWDNSDMPEFGFDTAYDAVFAPAGFRELELRGLGPINAFVWSTSVLYRPGNILAL